MSKSSNSDSVVSTLNNLIKNSQDTINNQQFIDLSLAVAANPSDEAFNQLSALIEAKSIDLSRIFDNDNNNILGIAAKAKSYDLASYFCTKITDHVSFITHKNTAGITAQGAVKQSKTFELYLKFENLFLDNGYNALPRLVKNTFPELSFHKFDEDGNEGYIGQWNSMRDIIFSFINMALEFDEGKKYFKNIYSISKATIWDKFFSVNCKNIKLETCKFFVENFELSEEALLGCLTDTTISNFEVASYLLQLPQVKSQDITKLSPILHKRIAKDNIEACKLLLHHCPALKQQQAINDALKEAIAQNNFGLVKFFIDNGATTNIFSEDYNSLNILGVECIRVFEGKDILAPYHQFKSFNSNQEREQYHTDSPLFSTIPGAYFVQVVLADTNKFIQCFEKIPNFHHLLLQAKTCKLIKFLPNSDLMQGVTVREWMNPIDALLAQKFELPKENEAENINGALVLGNQNASSSDTSVELHGNCSPDDAA